MSTSFFGGAFFSGEFFNANAVVIPQGGGGGRKRRKIIRRSDFANQEEFREAMQEVFVVLPTRKVELPTYLEDDDDDALLAVVLRVLH